VAVMNVIGQMGPLVGTSVFPREEGPWYVKGMTVCAAFMLMVGFLAAVLRWVLARENMRNKERSGGDYQGVALDEGGLVGEKRNGFEYML